MLFKSPSLSIQFDGLHPELRRVLKELDAKLAEWGFEQLTITDLWRDRAENAAIYLREGLAAGLTTGDAKWRAEHRFSWHFVMAAADARSTKYTAKQRKFILSWLTHRCPRHEWEVLEHTVGAGMHFHIARKDEEWRRAREAAASAVARSGGNS